MAYSYTYLIPARIRSGRIPDAKTGPDLYEHLGRNPFVMMSANWWEDGTWRTRTCLKAIFFMDEVDVDLDVLCATIMDGVGSHINRTDIIAVDNCH